ncbi:MAG: hypothetical protein KatS3mg111_2667 [Pirellulaceae bacterium]|nr:MAG: hypothetical protein KatS3mg111_2667 [Pirellulaceae bacterium]
MVAQGGKAGEKPWPVANLRVVSCQKGRAIMNSERPGNGGEWWRRGRPTVERAPRRGVDGGAMSWRKVGAGQARGLPAMVWTVSVS